MHIPRDGSERGGALRVFLLAFVVYAYFMPRWADWNIDSRLDLVHAVVDEHTVRIDQFHENTWDKAVYQGHYYSDKAPGTAFLGILVYGAYTAVRHLPPVNQAVLALARNDAWDLAISLGRTNTQASPARKGRVLGGCQRAGLQGNVQYIRWGNRLVPPMPEWALSKYLVTIGVDALLSALFVAFFFWFLSFFTNRDLYRWILTALYALGTAALPYSTVLYSHQIAAACLFTGFGLLFLRARGAVGWPASAASAFLLGFAFFTEYTVVLILVALGLYAVWILRHRMAEVGLMTLTGSIPVLALFAYNYACFGSPLDTGYSHDFCWSSAQAAGFAGFTYPHLDALLNLTFLPYRGLFYLSPFLLLAVPGVILMARDGYRLEALLCLVVGCGFLLAISAYWGWNGGQVEGPRYLVPAIPFLALPVVFYLNRLSRFPVGWLILCGTAAWSLFAVWAEFLGGYLFPVSWWPDPIFQYSLPKLQADEIAPNAGLFLGLSGWQSLIPLCLLVLLIALWPRRFRAVGSPVIQPLSSH